MFLATITDNGSIALAIPALAVMWALTLVFTRNRHD